jgi:acetolactate synthase-1/3 small subunit
MNKSVISAWVQNQPGVLAHIAGMFAARGFNIDSLVVGRTEDPDISRMTIVVGGDEHIIEQVRKQLGKVIPVVKIRDFTDTSYVERDLLLIRIHSAPAKRPEVCELVRLFRGRIVDVSRDSVMAEMTGTEEKVEAFIDLVRPYGIREMARTGLIAIQRGQPQPNRGHSEAAI